MAKRIIEELLDDIDGSEADGTTRFALDGDEFEIDLSGKNREKLQKVLAPYITKARAVRAPRATSRRAAVPNARKLDRQRSAEIRRWAKTHGITVSERGRIAESVVRQYEAAN